MTTRAVTPPPPWLASPPGGESPALVLAAVAATFGVNAIVEMKDEETQGYALIGAGLLVGVAVYGLRQACGSVKTGFCLLGAG